MTFHSWVDLTREVPGSTDHELQAEKVRVLSCLDRLDSQFKKHDTIQLMELLFEFWKLCWRQMVASDMVLFLAKLKMACERKLLESEATTCFFVLLGTKGKKETLEWCMKANLIASRYECPRCEKEMRLQKRKGTVDGYE
ncbi:hypothetical protein TNCV_4151951 [Trichonephila clavipes]|nr:hypothetical protein TNCV_4151951 [Trichonephila clavipes]